MANNREILFRGFHPCENWDTTIYVEGKTVKGRWVEGYYVKLNNGGKKNIDRIYTGYAETDCGEWYPDSYEVLPSTICRYTGLTDKSSRKIFKGDRVRETFRILNGNIGTAEYNVEWNDYECGFHLIFETAHTEKTTHLTINGRYEVIGTIWDKEDADGK